MMVFQSNKDTKDMEASELSSYLARGSFICLYLINLFSQVLNMSEAVSEILGLSERVVEFLNHLCIEIEYHRDFIDTSFSSSTKFESQMSDVNNSNVKLNVNRYNLPTTTSIFFQRMYESVFFKARQHDSTDTILYNPLIKEESGCKEENL
jgi:hypothetical protein